MKLKFPAEFYLIEETVILMKTSDPGSGILLDPLDLLTSTPWAIVKSSVNSEETEKKRKQLIFVDPVYKNRTPQEKQEINFLLQQARKEGFKIYLLGDQDLQEWRNTIIPDDYEIDLTDITVEHIRNLAWSQHRIPSNRLHLLDYFVINELVNGENCLFTRDFAVSDAGMQLLEGFLSYLTKDEDKKKKLKRIHCSNGHSSNKNDHALQVVKKLKQYSLDFFEAADLEGLMDIASPDKEKILADLLNHLPRVGLKSIDLSNCQSFPGAVPGIKEYALQDLQEIDLSGTHCSRDEIVEFLKLVPNIKALNITFSAKITGCFENLTKNQLFKLENISLNRSDCSVGDFVSLFEAAPNIKEIDLSRFKKISNFFQAIAKENLASLEEISLRETTCNTDNLQQLFEVAPNLKSLNLQNCKEAVGFFKSLKKNQLLALEEISLSRLLLGADDLQRIFAAAPNLKKISLAGCDKAVSLFKDLKKDQWRSLEEINLSSLPLEVGDLQQLFEAAPNLKKIKVSYTSKSFKQIEQFLKAFDKAKPQLLEEVNFGVLAVISREQLEQLYKIALPNLKRVNCSLPAPEATESLTHSSPLLPSSVSTEPSLSSQQSSSEPLSDTFLSTKSTNQTLLYAEYFPGIKPNNYRLLIWQPDLDSHDLTTRKFKVSDDFLEVSDAVNPLKTAVSYDREKYICHSGRLAVTQKEGQAFILPSLDAQEKIFNIKVVDKDGTVINHAALKLEYSLEDRLYRLILPKAGDYSITFEVAIPAEKSKIPKDIDDLVSFYQTFPQAEARETPKQTTLRAYADYYREQKTGACRHRALAAYAQLLQRGYYPENVRIIENDVHALLEVKVEETWHLLCLGGYPAPLKKQEVPFFREKNVVGIPIISKKDNNLVAENPPETLENHQLYVISKPSDLIPLYTKYTEQYHSEHIFVAVKPSQLNLTGHRITQSGKMISGQTDLKIWLDKHFDQKGLIVVDIRDFKENEIAQLNDLLDRKLDGQDIRQEIQIVLVDNQNRYYGPDFRRRVPKKITLNEPEKPLLLPLPTQVSVESHVRLEIDLFNSPFYERLLVGFWQLQSTETGLKLTWKKGQLLEAIENAKGEPLDIVFKNPPLQQGDFKTFLASLQSLKEIRWSDQTVKIPENIAFYESSGYAWDQLSTNMTLEPLGTEDVSAVFCLSNANILSFIADPAYFFSTETNLLECQDSYLTRAKKENKPLRVMCVPGLLESTLAQFLTATREKNVSVIFVTPEANSFPEKFALRKLSIEPKEALPNIAGVPNVSWELQSDVYARIRALQAQENFQGTFFDMSSLSAADLGHYAEFSEKEIENFLKNSTLAFKAPFSDIVQKLKNGEHVILTGRISSALYETLTKLSLGHIEGEKFPGQLTIVAALEEKPFVMAVTGKALNLPSVKSSTLAEKERTAFIEAMEEHYKPFSKDNTDPDEERSQEIDNRRLTNVQEALQQASWVMLEGKTGIGKSYFLQQVLPKKLNVCHSLEEWLGTQPINDQPLVLVIDEANFNSELQNKGANFLERFQGLHNIPPGFLWKGKYYPLTPQHKVIFAFNPKSYGQGRRAGGFLEEHNRPISFEALPDFYVRARLIEPCLKQALNHETLDHKLLSGPIVEVYRWLIGNATEEVLITPREIKLMVNVMAAKIKLYNITDQETLMRLATEVAYEVGRQTVIDNKILLPRFDQAFTPPQRIRHQSKARENYLPHQQETYDFIQAMVAAKDMLSDGNTDLGLGGIILEGSSGIGKTFFVNKIAEEYENSTFPRRKIYRISPSMPFSEKERLLKAAFEEGALVLAEEFNTSLWPNKALNNYLMGLDADGKPAKKPGFMLIGTQNPPSFVGRSEEDPAIRRRVVKRSLENWPCIEPQKLPMQRPSNWVAPKVDTAQSPILYGYLHSARKVPLKAKDKKPKLGQRPLQKKGRS